MTGCRKGHGKPPSRMRAADDFAGAALRELSQTMHFHANVMFLSHAESLKTSQGTIPMLEMGSWPPPRVLPAEPMAGTHAREMRRE